MIKFNTCIKNAVVLTPLIGQKNNGETKISAKKEYANPNLSIHKGKWWKYQAIGVGITIDSKCTFNAVKVKNTYILK